MAWQQISINVPHEFVEPISYVFERYGHGVGIQSLGSDTAAITTFLPTESQSRMARIEIGVNLAKSIATLGDLNITLLDNDTDWRNAWKQHFSVLKITDSIIIKPSWLDYEPKNSDIVIELDPGFAFGTGYHPTTHSCLILLEKYLTKHSSVLDFGTGSGIISIAAAKLALSQISAIDIDPMCIKSAKKNSSRCGTTELMDFYTGTLPHKNIKNSEYDYVVANISARIGIEKSSEMLDALKPEGILILSGIINNQAIETKKHFQAKSQIIEEYWKEDWVTFVIKKFNE